MALEIKRLVKEAEARQGRLEEARDRGATATEALRASKVLCLQFRLFSRLFLMALALGIESGAGWR